jgi:hypothetical protein
MIVQHKIEEGGQERGYKEADKAEGKTTVTQYW